MADAAPRAGQPVAYQNGRIVPAVGAGLPVDDHGVLFGAGFFETFRTSGGRPLLWDQHRRRLRQACAVARIQLPPTFLATDETRVREAVTTLLERHGLADAVFRYTVTAGNLSVARDGAGYDQPAELLTLRPLPPAAPVEGVALRLLKLARDNGEWLPRPKSLNYLNALLGAAELKPRAAAASDEGLFLTRDGRHVVETARQNVAWVKGGRWFFPDPALGAVAGTCWQWLLDSGIEAEPCRAGLEELISAEAVVVMNSVRGVTPVRVLWDVPDRVVLGSWESHAHPLVTALGRRWSDLVDAAREGCTP